MLGYAVIDRFVLLQLRMRTVADNGNREKSELTSTLIRASDELATFLPGAAQQRSSSRASGLPASPVDALAADADPRTTRRMTPPV